MHSKDSAIFLRQTAVAGPNRFSLSTRHAVINQPFRCAWRSLWRRPSSSFLSIQSLSQTYSLCRRGEAGNGVRSTHFLWKAMAERVTLVRRLYFHSLILSLMIPLSCVRCYCKSKKSRPLYATIASLEVRLIATRSGEPIFSIAMNVLWLIWFILFLSEAPPTAPA